ncbi:class I SAM-dependent methyltransferase [Dietzia sp.]|uniref:class I SAM-dependent methyltransferase n=1 Tax=Dietzia sp. TaxID=1871616 RepID=UPI002FDA5767
MSDAREDGQRGHGPEENLWLAGLRENADKSAEYAERWRRMVAECRDIDGEARLADAMVPRGSRILDAGCGTGRLAGYLARAGHEAWGVDLDPALVEVARADHPGAHFEVQNLAELSIAGDGGEPLEFDLIVSAGNVMAFLAGSERAPALRGIARHLAPAGRAVIGYGSGPGRTWDFEDFVRDAAEAGLALQQRFSTWDLRPANGEFFVGVFGRAD